MTPVQGKPKEAQSFMLDFVPPSSSLRTGFIVNKKPIGKINAYLKKLK
jgi:hypothetical protein